MYVFLILMTPHEQNMCNAHLVFRPIVGCAIEYIKQEYLTYISSSGYMINAGMQLISVSLALTLRIGTAD
jgi:hypothetical protein